MTPAKYVKRPIETEACQWHGDGTNDKELEDWCNPQNPEYSPDGCFVFDHIPGVGHATLWVDVRCTRLKVFSGDWIVKDRYGFYPVKNDVFVEFHQKVDIMETGADMGGNMNMAAEFFPQHRGL